MKLKLFLLSLFFHQSVLAASTVTSQFGFTATLPDGWFLLTPKDVEKTFDGETQKSLGIPDSVDKDTISALMNKIKGGNVEFYYDSAYLGSHYQNHISAQLGQPIAFASMDEVKTRCENTPNHLTQLYGEPVNLLACNIVPSNDRLVFSIAYTIESLNLTIIHETVQVNNNYSLELVGGSANDVAGLKRVRAAQQVLIDTVTRYLQEQQKEQ